VFENGALKGRSGGRLEKTAKLGALQVVRFTKIRVIESGRMRWARHVAHIGAMKNGFIILIGKSEGSRSLRRPRRRYEDIRMGLREMVWKAVKLIYQTQDRYQWQVLVNTVMNLWVP
jgi:hypothetical protein